MMTLAVYALITLVILDLAIVAALLLWMLYDLVFGESY